MNTNYEHSDRNFLTTFNQENYNTVQFLSNFIRHYHFTLKILYILIAITYGPNIDVMSDASDLNYKFIIKSYYNLLEINDYNIYINLYKKQINALKIYFKSWINLQNKKFDNLT